MLKEDEVKHIAELARIGLKKDEIKKYQKDISAVLDYFKKLEELDTKNVYPVEHIVETFNISREDNRKGSEESERRKIIKNVPEEKDGHLKVRSVL